jgi:hypothetical protein
MTLSEVATFLNASPRNWNAMTAQQRTDVLDAIKPGASGFNPAQRTWFKDWWLLCTPPNLAAINAALPARTRAGGLTNGGVTYLNIDLLTDCDQAGGTYFAARSVIQGLTCINAPGLQPQT